MVFFLALDFFVPNKLPKKSFVPVLIFESVEGSLALLAFVVLALSFLGHGDQSAHTDCPPIKTANAIAASEIRTIFIGEPLRQKSTVGPTEAR